MKLYRFSPIISKDSLFEAIQYLHETCHKLCYESVGEYLPVGGNVGVFCHDYREYEALTELREVLTDASVNYHDKYFKLHEPITIAPNDGIPGATYQYLYIRQVDPYRSQVGDIDFVMAPEAHAAFKAKLKPGEFTGNARIFERLDENMIELWDPKLDVASYIVDDTMAHKISAGL